MRTAFSQMERLKSDASLEVPQETRQDWVDACLTKIIKK